MLRDTHDAFSHGAKSSRELRVVHRMEQCHLLSAVLGIHQEGGLVCVCSVGKLFHTYLAVLPRQIKDGPGKLFRTQAETNMLI